MPVQSPPAHPPIQKNSARNGNSSPERTCCSEGTIPRAKAKVLIAEDEESLLKLICLILASKGYDVKGVTNGQAALEAAANQNPDLVLLDVSLPGVDGMEVCRRIKCAAQTKNLPVIMLTARTNPEDRARGEAVGADCYITKPFKSAFIVDTVQKFIGRGSENPG